MTTSTTMQATRLAAGWDLGKSGVRLVIVDAAREAAGGRRHEVPYLRMREARHEGDPFDLFMRWYREENLERVAAMGATGRFAARLAPPVFSSLPEETCLEEALALFPEGPLNLLRLTATGYSVLTRNGEGLCRYLENEKCSSGTGETMVKIASRFGLSIEEADALACAAETAIPITARCSVFAKSEMTHFGNQGRDRGALFRGYFESVARHLAALHDRIATTGPVYLLGGGAKLAAFRKALASRLGRDVLVPASASCLEALGAARLAAGESCGEALPRDPAALVKSPSRRFAVLAPPNSEQVLHLPELASDEPVAETPAILGLDLGSTGSKAVLLSLATGRPLLDLYDRTRGNPVEAAKRLVGCLLSKETPRVQAIGVTGSGREAVATVLRAAFPPELIVVENEIVAHAKAAVRLDPDQGQSLSIVEIGGQDAKFIQVEEGRIVESDMNKACSAGTGSFLEEQAVFYGLRDVTELAPAAAKARRPPELGQMCTVFVADAAGEAVAAGFSREEILAGFHFSVIHNYLNRVMGRRSLQRTIFFQGKPATSPLLAATLAEVTGRRVVVPPNPGAMGALGIALLTMEELSSLASVAPFDLSLLASVSVVSTEEIRCRDPRCATYCIVEKAEVAIGEERRTIYSGGACPKFEVAGMRTGKLPREAPDPFALRRGLLLEMTGKPNGQGSAVAIPVVGPVAGIAPYLATLMKETGERPRLVFPASDSLAKGEDRCVSYDACAPVKIAHGLLLEEAGERVFFPKAITLPDREGPGGMVCPMEQALPDILKARGLGDRLSAPIMPLRDGFDRPGPQGKFSPRVARRAAAVQRSYEEELRRIGDEALAYAAKHGIPVVLVVGSLHVIHDPVINAGIPRILRQNGVMALPMDCFRIPEEIPKLPRVVWADANRALRAAFAARQMGGVYPLFLSAFDCGPASFVEHLFEALMEGYPHTVLESDGHGGAAGYVTRSQAFLHTVRSHDGEPSPPPEEVIRILDETGRPALDKTADSRLVIFSLSDHFGEIASSFYRSLGFDACAAPTPSPLDLARGRRDCSGKECLPYQLIWSSFRKEMEATGDGKPRTFLQIGGTGTCRNCMFALKDELSIRCDGLEAAVNHLRPERSFEGLFVTKFFSGVVAWDIFRTLRALLMPKVENPSRLKQLYDDACRGIARVMEEPGPLELSAFVGRGRFFTKLKSLLARYAREMAALPDKPPNGRPRRTILLSGDIYLRLDGAASGGLIERLNDRGLSVIPEGAAVLVEYLANERSKEILMLPNDPIRSRILYHLLPALRRILYRTARQEAPWLPEVNVRRIREASRTLLAKHPIGEAPITAGSVIEHFEERMCDGAVIVGPFGCGPSLIAESLLRSRQDIPMLFLYGDGSPIPDRKLDAFALKLRREKPRAVLV